MPNFSNTSSQWDTKVYLSARSSQNTTDGSVNNPWKLCSQLPVFKLRNKAVLTNTSIESDIVPEKSVLFIGSGTYQEFTTDPSSAIRINLSQYENLGNYAGSQPSTRYYNLDIIGDGYVNITDKSVSDDFKLSYRSFINIDVDMSQTSTLYMVNITIKNINFDYYYNPLELIMFTNNSNANTLQNVYITLNCIDCKFNRTNIRHTYYTTGLQYYDETNAGFTGFFSNNLSLVNILYRNCNFIGCEFNNIYDNSQYPIYFNLREEAPTYNINPGSFSLGVANIALIKNCTFNGYSWVWYMRISNIINTLFLNNRAMDETLTSTTFTNAEFDIASMSYCNYDVETNDLFSTMGLLEANIPSISASDIIKSEITASNQYYPKYLNYRKAQANVATTAIIKKTILITSISYTSATGIIVIDSILANPYITIDGVSILDGVIDGGLSLADETANPSAVIILIKNGLTTSNFQTVADMECNGLYFVSAYSSATNTLTLKRVSYNDTYFDMLGTQVFVSGGTQNANTFYTLASTISTAWATEPKTFIRTYTLPENNASMFNNTNDESAIFALRHNNIISDNLGLHIPMFYLNLSFLTAIERTGKFLPIFDYETGIITDFHILYPGEYLLSNYIEELTLTNSDIQSSIGSNKIVVMNFATYTTNNNYTFTFKFQKTATYFYISSISVNFTSSTFVAEPNAYALQVTNVSLTSLQTIQPKVALVNKNHLNCLTNIEIIDTSTYATFPDDAELIYIKHIIITDGGLGFTESTGYTYTIKYWYANDVNEFVDISSSISGTSPDTATVSLIMYNTDKTNLVIDKTSSLYKPVYERNFIGSSSATHIVPFVKFGSKNTEIYNVTYDNTSGVKLLSNATNLIETTDDTLFAPIVVTNDTDGFLLSTEQISDNIIFYTNAANTVIETNTIDLGAINKISNINLNALLDGIDAIQANGAVGKLYYSLKWGNSASDIDVAPYVDFEYGIPPYINFGTAIIGTTNNNFNYNNRRWIYARYLKIKIILV